MQVRTQKFDSEDDNWFASDGSQRRTKTERAGFYKFGEGE